MSIKIVNGDVTKATEDYIVHNVNYKGGIISGVACQIADKFPDFKKQYKGLTTKHNRKNCEELLGHYIETKISDNQTILSLFGSYQYKFRNSYNYFISCLEEIVDHIPTDKTIAMPYYIYCGFGCGDWETTYSLIAYILEEYNITFYKLG